MKNHKNLGSIFCFLNTKYRSHNKAQKSKTLTSLFFIYLFCFLDKLVIHSSSSNPFYGNVGLLSILIFKKNKNSSSSILWIFWLLPLYSNNLSWLEKGFTSKEKGVSRERIEWDRVHHPNLVFETFSSQHCNFWRLLFEFWATKKGFVWVIE